jgi:N6-adenosine-specific RNA methylase IME4
MALNISQFNIIYADPPWHYAKRNTNTAFGGGVSDKYPTMTLEEICALPIKKLAADQSMLFIWTTMPYLMRTNQVIESWGFQYVTTAFTWVKTNLRSGTIFKGVGNYTKHNAELCLLARRGQPLQRENRDVSQVVMEPRREHSRKPDRVRSDIVRLFGDRPRIELFARNTSPGWSVWGNEVNKFDPD